MTPGTIKSSPAAVKAVVSLNTGCHRKTFSFWLNSKNVQNIVAMGPTSDWTTAANTAPSAYSIRRNWNRFANVYPPKKIHDFPIRPLQSELVLNKHVVPLLYLVENSEKELA